MKEELDVAEDEEERAPMLYRLVLAPVAISCCVCACLPVCLPVIVMCERHTPVGFLIHG